MNLKGIHDNTNHCVEDVLMNYCIYNNINYIYMYSDSWVFKVNKEAKSIMDIMGNLKIDEKIPHRVAFEKLMKIKINFIEKSILELEELLKSGNFLCMLYNSYYCQWDKSYHKYRIPHCFFINDVSVSGNKLICEDPYLSKSNVELKYTEFILNGGEVFVCDNTNYANNLSWDSVIQYNLGVIDNDFDNIRYFAYKIKKCTSLQEINNYDDIFYSPLLRGVRDISNSRLNLAKLYRYIAQKNDIQIFNEFSLQMNEIGNEWQAIKNKITKCIFFKDNYKQRIRVVDDLQRIADTEETLSNKMKKVVA